MFQSLKMGPMPYLALTLLAFTMSSAAQGPVAGLDPKAISIRLPADIQWKGSASGVDGARDGDVILEIVGMGPETLTPAEVK